MTRAFTEELLVPDGSRYVRVCVRVWDPETIVSTVICVHDVAGDSADFMLLAHRLAEAGVRTVAMDFPGFGRSAALGDPALYTPHLLVECLAQTNRYRRGPVTFLGAGFGASLMLLYLASSGIPISRILLHEADLATGLPSSSARAHLAARARATFATYDGAASYLLAHRANLAAIPDPIRSGMIDEMIRESDDSFRFRCDPAVVLALENAQAFDLRALVGAASVPCHLIEPDADAGREVPVLTLRQCEVVLDLVLGQKPTRCD